MDNVNRWLRQMTLPPLTKEEVAMLPTKTLLGRPAAFVDISGTFIGMRNSSSKPEHRLIGLILEYENTSIFVKMTGPEVALNSELKNFELFCSSLRLAARGK